MNDETKLDTQEASQHLEKLNMFADNLIKEASVIQQQISTAKTTAKREYYGKKMKKLGKELQRVLATKQLLTMAAQKNASNNSTPATA